MTWQEAIAGASSKLETRIKDAALNAEYLALHVLQLWSKTEMRKFLGTTLSPEEEAEYHLLVSRRIKQEPLQHIIGETEFFGIRFLTSPAALIPRPDTETLIEETLKEVGLFPIKDLNILDIGTGSGIIALTLASKLPAAKVIGIDISAEALELAMKNKERLGDRNTAFEHVDIFDKNIGRIFGGKIDILVSNPPYIAAHEVESLDAEVRNYDPRIALTDESDGLRFYRRIAAIAPLVLSAESRIIVEIGYGMAEKVLSIFSGTGFHVLRVAKDIQGIERVIVIQVQRNK